jgi:hypothetical protein
MPPGAFFARRACSSQNPSMWEPAARANARRSLRDWLSTCFGTAGTPEPLLMKQRDRSRMYESFFGLHTDPFRLTADQRFYFNHPSYIRAKGSVQYALYRAEGFVMITGRPGTGKTTLAGDLVASLSPRQVRRSGTWSARSWRVVTSCAWPLTPLVSMCANSKRRIC